MGPSLFKLPKVLDNRGNLSFIEEGTHLPFKIKRVYWIYDVPSGEKRGGHAYRLNQELIIALSGSFEVVVSDGEKDHRFYLNRPWEGVFIPKMMWRWLENFSTNSLALVIASTNYNECDYIRKFEDFSNLI